MRIISGFAIIRGYKIYMNDRAGGGVALYVKDSIVK